MTSGKACGIWRSACVAVCAAMFAGVSALAGTGPRDEGPAAFIWDADHGMRDLTDLLIDEYGLDLGGVILSSVNGISADGTVMWGTKGITSIEDTLYWRLTLDGDTAVYEPLTELGGFAFPGMPRVTLNVMSRDGKVFGGRIREDRDDVTEAFIWSQETGILRLGRLLEGSLSEVSALSFDGSVAVGRARVPQDHAFRWTAETGMVDLGDLPGGANFSWARAVSDDGVVVGGDSSSTRSGTSLTAAEAFRWTEETGLVGLGDIPPSDRFHSRASVISGDGRLIGGIGGYFYTLEEGWEQFGFSAKAISFDGTYMVGEGNFGQGVEGFLWSTEEGFLPLGDLPGGRFRSEALGVSDDGRIVVGWVEVPEPGTLVVIAVGITLAMMRSEKVWQVAIVM